jgi:hypothetical protein
VTGAPGALQGTPADVDWRAGKAATEQFQAFIGEEGIRAGIAAEVPGARADSQPNPVLAAGQQHPGNEAVPSFATLSQAQADTATTDALFASPKDNERR